MAKETTADVVRAATLNPAKAFAGLDSLLDKARCTPIVDDAPMMEPETP